MSPEPVATAPKVLNAIRRRCARDRGWAVFQEVTTGETSRRADAIAVNLWTNSRDHQVHGFEVKVARGDWLNELKNPDKSDYFRERCTYWWIAAGRGVVKREELPPKWGLLVLHGDTLRLEKQAEVLDGQGLDEVLMTVLLRHAHDTSPSRPVLQAEYSAGYTAGKKFAEEGARTSAKYQQQRMEDEFQDWQKLKPDFERASGVHLNAVNAKTAGRAYRIVYRSKDRERDALIEVQAMRRRLEFMVEQAQRMESEAAKTLGLDPEAA